MSDAEQPETYFSGLEDTYERHRPGYPVEAARWVVGERAPGAPAPRVADIGAGTGLFSRALVAAGAEVVAIEPNEAMRRRGRAVTRGLAVDWRSGRGEATGLADASVDAAACAQSFHWMDADAAIAELRRIVRPGGTLALAWNVRDDSHPPTARYGEIISRAQDAAEAAGRVVSRMRSLGVVPEVALGRFERRAVAHRRRHDLDGLLGRARSCSYWPPPGEPLREELERALAAVFDSHAEDGEVELAYRCEVTLSEVGSG